MSAHAGAIRARSDNKRLIAGHVRERGSDHVNVPTAVPTRNLIRTVCVTDRAVLGRRAIASLSRADVRSVEVDGRLAYFGRSSDRRVSVHGLQAPAIRGCGQAACRW